jgi:hypothetical protein
MKLTDTPFFDINILDLNRRTYLQNLHSAVVATVKTAIEKIPIKIKGHDYHNRRHTELDVVGGFIELGSIAVKKDKISVEDFYIGLVAAATHDLFYDKDLAGTGENESRSTVEALKLMKKEKIFTKKDLSKVTELHRATIFVEAGKNGIVQSAVKGQYLEELITDIDTGGIGMKWPEAKNRIDNYYREVSSKEPSLEDSDYIKFLEYQSVVLSGHSYKTSEARSKYGHLESNVKNIRLLINSIK